MGNGIEYPRWVQISWMFVATVLQANCVPVRVRVWNAGGGSGILNASGGSGLWCVSVDRCAGAAVDAGASEGPGL